LCNSITIKKYRKDLQLLASLFFCKKNFLYLLKQNDFAMIKFNELKQGDYVMAQFEDRIVQGEVTELKRDQKLACIKDGVQEFWFDGDHLQPIPLNDEQLINLGFQKNNNDDGSVKYSKGAFRILIHSANDFSEFEVWYREDKRHIKNPIGVHELQNHYLDMTKVHLTNEVFQ
jgi:hypothetical protein